MLKDIATVAALFLVYIGGVCAGEALVARAPGAFTAWSALAAIGGGIVTYRLDRLLDRLDKL